MHIGSSQRHISQAGRSEFALIVWVTGQLFDARIIFWICPFAIEVEEARVVKPLLGQWQLAVLNVVREVEATMTVIALHLLAKKKRFPALG